MTYPGTAVIPVIGLAGALLLFFVELMLSMALVATSALSRVALRRLSADSDEKLRFLVELRTPASTYRSAAHLGRQLSLIGGCALLGWSAHAAGWFYPWRLGLLIGALLGVLVIDALVARSLALISPKTALRFTSRIVRWVHFVMYPLVAPLSRLLRRASTTNNKEEQSEEEQDEEVEAFIEVGESEGILDGDEGRMIRGIADLDETRVREIMTARTDIVSLPVETTVSQARKALIAAGHSRVPVFRHSIDNVVGVLHARDLFRAWEDGKEDVGILEFVRPAYFVPETLTLAELLAELRLRTQIAMVIDEYGGIAGLVSLEDLMEEIVGDIRDEHDTQETAVVQEQDGSWLVSGVAHVKELEELFDLDIGERDFDTVGGLVLTGLGRVPREGEKLEAHGLVFEILQADRRRVYQVRVARLNSPGEAKAEA